MRITLKNVPRLKLTDLLRRRKMTLRRMLDEFGITTYEGLVVRCERMGVLPPPEKDFKAAFPDPPVNNPQEGVVVLDPPPVVDEISGRIIDPDAPIEPGIMVITDSPQEGPTEPSQKKRRPKKDQSPIE